MHMGSMWSACAMMLLSALCNTTPAHPNHLASRLQRNYTPGAILEYEMAGNNDGWKYTIHATAVTKTDLASRFYEEVSWSNLRSNASQTLSPSTLAFRQTLSLDDPARYMVVPDLSKVQPLLIGPITDTLTFYSDLLLAINTKLVQAGQHQYVQKSKTNSWADGQRVLIGEDAVDFDLRLIDVDVQNHKTVLLVKHVPSKEGRIKLLAPWMKTPVADTVNNFVQVEHAGSTYIADVGQETFEVRITLDSRDGKIITASMHNPVILVSRTCVNQKLTDCGLATRKSTMREVTLTLVQ